MEFRILAPTAILGYGFPEKSFEAGLARKPDLIAVDGGSTDPGPYYLGSGKSFVSRQAEKRDLSYMLRAASAHNIPCIIGTAGGSGATPHVDATLQIIREIVRENSLRFETGVIYADQTQESVLQKLDTGEIQAVRCAPELTGDDVSRSTRIVAQMGVEPIVEMLDAGCQLIVCGRCYDPAVFAAPALRLGFDPGPALHLGKVLECAAIAAIPGSGRDCAFGVLHQDHFELEALGPQRQFTPASVAAHTLYEKSNPSLLAGPGGTLDVSGAEFKSNGNGGVIVRGSVFNASLDYWIKLEGVIKTGYRTISISGIRDPVFIRHLDSALDDVRDEVVDQYGAGVRLEFHRYGRNAVMGPLEPDPAGGEREIGLIIDAVADAPDTARAACGLARSMLLHYGFPGRITTAGNLAILYSPSDVDCGEVYEFSVYHLMRVENGKAIFSSRRMSVE